MTKKPETVNREDMIKRKDNLIYKKYARVPFTGVYESFHENGQLESRYNIKNGIHDTYEWFHDNGQLESRVNYKNGQREGLHEWFHINGCCKRFSSYKNGIKVKSTPKLKYLKKG